MDDTTTALLDYCDSIGDCCRGDIAAQTTAILSHLQMMRAQCETVRTLAINLEMSEEDSIARMRSGLYRNTAGAAIREAGAAETALRNLVHALRDLAQVHQRTKEELTTPEPEAPA